jgi:hypothetical protein
MKPYVRIDTEMLKKYAHYYHYTRIILINFVSRTLMLCDADDNLAALVITHLIHNMPDFWNKFKARMKVLYSRDMLYDRSRRIGYDYVAIHYHWYNRYAELASEHFFKYSITTIINLIDRGKERLKELTLISFAK